MPAALAAYRKARAVELALIGASYDDIAEELGYANRGTAWRTVQKALKAREVEAVDAYRNVELARLDGLHEASWGSARVGNLQAVNACLRVSEQRCRLLGLTV